MIRFPSFATIESQAVASPSEEDLLTIAGSVMSGSHGLSDKSCSPALAELLRGHHLRSLAHRLGVEGLEEASRECAVMAAFHRRCLEEVGSEFSARGIAWSAIKGASYAWGLYEEPALRPMTDLDLLVRAEDFECAARCLVQCGFSKWTISARQSHAQTYLRAPHEIVDLHRSILQPLRSNAGMAGVWERASASDAFSGYFELDLVDLCCVHIAHVARHEFVVPLVSYVDLRRLLARISDAGAMGRLHEQLARWRLDFSFEVIEAISEEIVSGGRGKSVRPRRMRLVMPTMRELVAGRHRSRRAQIGKKLALFPRDSMVLGMGWAIRGVEDRLIRGRSR